MPKEPFDIADQMMILSFRVLSDEALIEVMKDQVHVTWHRARVAALKNMVEIIDQLLGVLKTEFHLTAGLLAVRNNVCEDLVKNERLAVEIANKQRARREADLARREDHEV